MTWNSFLLVQEINKLYEAKQNFKQAIVYYEEATDLFQSEDVTASANQCSQKTTSWKRHRNEDLIIKLDFEKAFDN